MLGGRILPGAAARRHTYTGCAQGAPSLGPQGRCIRKALPQPPPDTELGGFELISRSDADYEIHLKTQTDIHNLFLMTPYYYKTGVDDQRKLAGLDHLDTELSFAILIFRKKH
jgi:hypothetical protein